MDILIKGMEMPSCCMFCPLSNSTGCGLSNPPIIMTSKEMLAGHPDWCPLVPVPPHYDLIDHNALKIAVMDCDAETRIDFLKHAMDCINKAPVVIPSDMPTYEAEEGE